MISLIYALSVVTISSISTPQWIAGLALPTPLIDTITLEGYVVENSKIKFVTSSCNEEATEIVIKDDMSLDTTMPFPQIGNYHICLIAPGASTTFLYSSIVIEVTDLSVVGSPASVDQFINIKHDVSISLTVEPEDITTITVFLSDTTDCSSSTVDSISFSTEITNSTSVYYEFTHGYNQVLTVCYRYAENTAVSAGTTLSLYSVMFDPAVWRPFYDIDYEIPSVELYSPYTNNVMINWIPRDESCASVTKGIVLNDLKVERFTKNGVLIGCVAFRNEGSYEAIPFNQHHIDMYDQVSIIIEDYDRPVVNKRFVVRVISNDIDKIEKLWWTNEDGLLTEQYALYDGYAPFTFTKAGKWWLVVKYYGEQPADYRHTANLTRYAAEMTHIDVLYWIKGMPITNDEAIKTTNLEISGSYLEDNDTIALNPSCQYECWAPELSSYTYTVKKVDDMYTIDDTIDTTSLPEGSCICYSFGEGNWMKYSEEILNIPDDYVVMSPASIAYMIPSSSLYRRLDSSIETRVDVELEGHVGILKDSYPFILRNDQDCTIDRIDESEVNYIETRKEQYGSAFISLNYTIIGMPEESYQLCYVIGNYSVVKVPIEIHYKEITPENIIVIRRHEVKYEIGNNSIGFHDGDEAFWSLGTDCTQSISDIVSLSNNEFIWENGITPFIQEDAHICIKFTGTTLFAPIKIVTLRVLGIDDLAIDLVVDEICSHSVDLTVNGEISSMYTVNYEGDQFTQLAPVSCFNNNCVFTVVDVYKTEAVKKVGVVVKFTEYQDAVFVPDVVITLRNKPTVLTSKMYYNHNHILELSLDVHHETETVSIFCQSSVAVYDHLPLDFLFDGKARATIQLSTPGDCSIQYNFEQQYCDALKTSIVGTVHVIKIESITPTIVNSYAPTEIILNTSTRIDYNENDYIALCDDNCECTTSYAQNKILSRSIVGSVIPQYYTNLQLSSMPVATTLNVCYNMSNTSIANTGLEMDIFRITSFELSSVPEGVTISKIPIVGSGIAVGDQLRLIPDNDVCNNLPTLETTIIYTTKYVADILSFPMIGNCSMAKYTIEYIPSMTNSTISLGEIVNVYHTTMTARADSPYNLFSKVDMTFVVEGSTNIQEMRFFFKYLNDDSTQYECATRPEKSEDPIPIICSFVNVPTTGEMCMYYSFQSSSSIESIWTDIERPVNDACYFIAVLPQTHRTGIQFEIIEPGFSEIVSTLDVYFKDTEDRTVARYMSSVNELEFIFPAVEDEVTAVAQYGSYSGVAEDLTVRVRGLKAMTTTVSTILTTVETPFRLTLIDIPEGSTVGFSVDTKCKQVMYMNAMSSTLNIVFNEPYTNLYVCVNYGNGFRYSGLPFFTVLEFRNAITIVANEDSRINYQYITSTPSDQCNVNEIENITVNSDCDWVSSIFAGDASLVIDNKVSTSLVFGANIEMNPICNRPIDGQNQWMIFEFTDCTHITGIEIYLLGIETDPHYIRIESSDVMNDNEYNWRSDAYVEIVNTNAGWYSLGEHFSISGKYLRLRIVDSTSPFIILSEIRFIGTSCNDASPNVPVKWVKYMDDELNCNNEGYEYSIKECTRTGIVNIPEVGEYGLCRYDETWQSISNFNMRVVGITSISNIHNLFTGASRTVEIEGYGIEDHDLLSYVSINEECSSLTESSPAFEVMNATSLLTFNIPTGEYKFCYKWCCF